MDGKPAQRPHPPILVGGNGPTVLDRVLDFGDVWMPNHDPEVADRMPELRRRAQGAGRDISVMIMGPPPDPATLEAYAEAGVQRVNSWLPSARRESVERELERCERAMSELLGT